MRPNFLFLIFTFLVFGCQADTVNTHGVVTKVGYRHIGRGNYKQSVTYLYSFQNKNYHAEESFWFNWQGRYSEGDSIMVQIERENPERSEILGKLLDSYNKPSSRLPKN